MFFYSGSFFIKICEHVVECYIDLLISPSAIYPVAHYLIYHQAHMFSLINYIKTQEVLILITELSPVG